MLDVRQSPGLVVCLFDILKEYYCYSYFRRVLNAFSLLKCFFISAEWSGQQSHCPSMRVTSSESLHGADRLAKHCQPLVVFSYIGQFFYDDLHAVL
jgi:hypothetical protein